MAHQSSSNRLKFDLIAVNNNNEALINVNGETYKFTVSAGGNGFWRDITTVRDWQQLATHITELFLEGMHTGRIDSAELVLSSDFSDIEVGSADPKIVTFDSATVRVGQNSHTFDSFNALPPAAQQVVNRKLTVISKDFATITPPIHPQRVSPVQPMPKAKTQPPIPKPIQPSIPTHDIDRSGQCLDSSIAYLMLKKAGLNAQDKTLVNRTANELRQSVAHYIQTKGSLDEDEAFAKVLVESVKNIPERQRSVIPNEIFRLANQTIPDNLLLVDMETVKTANNIREARSALRKFYAAYITNKASNGKMQNYLDAAFLYALSQIAPPKPFSNKIKVAIIQSGEKGNNFFSSKYPSEETLNIDSWLFIAYNGSNHYQAIDTDNQEIASQIDLMIVSHKHKIFTEFLEAINRPTSEQSLHEAPLRPLSGIALKEQLQAMRFEFPAAYYSIVRIIHSKDRPSDKPEETTVLDNTYIDAMSADDLEFFLQESTIYNAINALQVDDLLNPTT